MLQMLKKNKEKNNVCLGQDTGQNNILIARQKSGAIPTIFVVDLTKRKIRNIV